MRHACLAVGLSLWCALAGALEIEDRRLLPGTGTRVLRVLSTVDLAVFAPYLDAFHADAPAVTLDYTVLSSVELHRAIGSGAAYDLAISSATDLQFQLVNDGLARGHRSAATEALPPWARWRDLIFAFATEPAVVVVSTARFGGLPLPGTRQDLIETLRAHPERFRDAIGTYDVRESGLGYLLATREARATDAYWRLLEVMGRLEPRLYCCSGQMIDDVAAGRLALAYNVLGSYAAERLEDVSGGRVQVLRMSDYSNAIVRTAIVPAAAPSPDLAGRFLDRLLRSGLREGAAGWPLPPLGEPAAPGGGGAAAIRLGPALMVHLDPLNRRAFLAEWEDALYQR